MVVPTIPYFFEFKKISEYFYKFKYPELAVVDNENNIVGFLNSLKIFKEFFKGKDIERGFAGLFLNKEPTLLIKEENNYYTYFDLIKDYLNYNVSSKPFFSNNFQSFSLDDSLKKVLRFCVNKKIPIVFYNKNRPYFSCLAEEFCMFATIEFSKISQKIKNEKIAIKIKSISAKRQQYLESSSLIKFSNCVRDNLYLSKYLSFMISKKVLTVVTESSNLLTALNVYNFIKKKHEG